MVFSSIPAYLDPANWQQHPNHQPGSSGSNPQLPQPPQVQQPLQPAQPHVGGGAGSIRPGSMSDRARMANIPMPQTALNCPRCESTNTKFCYFNNYSLSQPRHFCKTCRRYWTRGGALRSVPVGGGCRRNKRSKGSNSKSSASGDGQTNSGSTSTVSCNSTGTAGILGLTPQLPPLRFMAAPLSQPTTDYGAGDIGLNFSGLSAPVMSTNEMNFQMGSNFLGGSGVGGGGGASFLPTGGIEQWRLQQPQQFPFFGGFDPSRGVFPFQSGIEPSGYVGEPSQVQPKLSASMLTQMASVKMEENQESNLSRQFMTLPGNDQWSGPAWMDLSSFSSSSTSNPL